MDIIVTNIEFLVNFDKIYEDSFIKCMADS